LTIRKVFRFSADSVTMPPPIVRRAMDTKGPRRPRAEAGRTLRLAAELLEPFVTRYAFAGSYRRGREDCGDGDLLILPKPSEAGKRDSSWRGALESGFEYLLGGVSRQRILIEGFPVDVIATTPEAWGAALCYLTGSRWHNIAMRVRAKDHGFTLNEYGLWRGKRRIAGRTEAEIYRALGLRWHPPACREGGYRLYAIRAPRTNYRPSLRSPSGGVPPAVALNRKQKGNRASGEGTDGERTRGSPRQRAPATEAAREGPMNRYGRNHPPGGRPAPLRREPPPLGRQPFGLDRPDRLP